MKKNNLKKRLKTAISLGLCTAMIISPIFETIGYADSLGEPSITIDTSDFSYDKESGYYDLDTEIQSLSGTIKGDSSKIKSFTYTVEDDQGITVKSGEITEEKKWSISDIGFVLGNNKVIFTIKTATKIITKTLNIYNEDIKNSENVDVDQSDTDGDGLLNYWEEYFGTDINNSDTDNDGISDTDEITILGSDPLKADTSDNEISDSDDDFDNDGLSNAEEIELGTDPYAVDSDGDSLLDFDEVNIYGTSPTLADTDNDGANDGWEIANGYDPLTRNKKFTITATSDDGQATLYSKKLTGEQAQDFGLYVSDDYNLKSVVGAKSKAYKLGSNVKAEITIPYTASSENEDPRIYEYDTTKQKFVSLKTTVKDGYLIANTKDSKDSLYIVLDKVEYDKNRNVNNEIIASSKDSNNDGISDGDTKKMCNGELLTSAGNLVFGDATYEEVQSNDDFDGDGLKNGEEVSVVQGDDGINYVLLNSSPILVDTDEDGINDNEDTAPLERGLKDGIIGAIQIYSRHNPGEAFYLGHAFIVFTSYVDNQTIAIKDLNCAYNYDSEQDTYVLREEKEDSYTLSRGEYVSIGNYRSQGLDVVYDSVSGDYEAFWIDSGLSEYLDKDDLSLTNLLGFTLSGNSSVVTGNTIQGLYGSSIRFNEEIADTYIYEDFVQYPNGVLTNEVTQEQLDMILEYDSNHNYYNLLSNNCSTIASGAWNLAYNDTLYARADSGLYSLFDTPLVLKNNILAREGSEQDVKTFGVSLY